MTARSRSPQDRRNIAFTSSVDVDAFVYADEASIWPCKLPNSHQQLKNYISTATKDIIYYVSDNEVFAIHTPTSRQELLAFLPFKPICIASGHGWVCLGGVNSGKCAFIDFQKASPFESMTRSWSTEVDDLLPLDLDPYSRALSDHHSMYDGATPHRRNQKVVMEKIGTDIVNGITISKFPSNRKDVADEIVGVFSNNDRTVTIYSLTQQATLKTLSLATQINHASISPDGELLVAVGDINKVWFFRRITRRRGSTQPSYDWDEIAVVRLVCTTPNDWCFSTAWSPSGHLCTVASQFGTITVFETSKIQEDMDHTDAVLHYMRSSRPTVTNPSQFIPSAPRSMAFSPEPWSLLAWAEDHGRITIVDLRDDFISRQTVHVDIHADKLKRETYTAPSSTRLSDAEREFLRIRRRGQALLSNDFETATSSATDHMPVAAPWRRFQDFNVNSQLLPNSIMSESDRELLELLGTERTRDNREARSAIRPYSINYSTSSHSDDAIYTPPLTFGQYMLNRTRHMLNEMESTSNPASWSGPRRQDSIAMPQETSERVSRTSAAHPTSFMLGPTLPLSASPSRLSDPGVNDTENRDHEVSHQTNTSTTTDTVRNNHSPNPDEYRTRQRFLSNDLLRYSHLRALERERGTEASSRWRTLSQSNSTPGSELRDLAESERFYREHARHWGRRIHELRERSSQFPEAHTPTNPSHEDTPYPDDISNDIMLGGETISRVRAVVQRHSTIDEVDIQGIGWSWDGRYLFVGTSDGIMQYKVNITGRMKTPRLQFA